MPKHLNRPPGLSRSEIDLAVPRQEVELREADLQRATDLTDFIERWQEKNDTTTKELAVLAGLSYSGLSQVMKRVVVPRVKTVQKLAEATGGSLSRLYTLSGLLTKDDVMASVVWSEQRKERELKLVNDCKALGPLGRGLLAAMVGLPRQLMQQEHGPESYDLVQFIAQWVELHQTTAEELFLLAKLPHSIYTDIRQKKGTTQPESLRQLASAMGIPPGWLFVAAGYMPWGDLQVITDLTTTQCYILAGYRTLTEAEQDLADAATRGMLEALEEKA